MDVKRCQNSPKFTGIPGYYDSTQITEKLGQEAWDTVERFINTKLPNIGDDTVSFSFNLAKDNLIVMCSKDFNPNGFFTRIKQYAVGISKEDLNDKLLNGLATSLLDNCLNSSMGKRFAKKQAKKV